MRSIIFILAAFGLVLIYYVIVPSIKGVLYLVKLRKTDGVEDFEIELNDYILSSIFSFNGRTIDIKTRFDTTDSFRDVIHTMWDYYDCLKLTFDVTMNSASEDPEMRKVYYIYTNDGGLVRE